MEALVNSMFDKVSEDSILLYDLFDAVREELKESGRPRLSVMAAVRKMLYAIKQVLKEEDRGFGCSDWNSAEDLHQHHLGSSGGGAPGNKVLGSESIHALTSDSVGSSKGTGGGGGGGGVGEESAIVEVLRVVITSILSDLAILPFWTVKISAVAHRGRLPELWPFQGFRVGIAAMYRSEGPYGLFKGAAPVCAGGLLRYIRRNRRLYSDYYWKTTHRLSTRLLRGDYARHSSDPEVMAQTNEGVLSRVVWATLLHPFDLVATRMVTESRPEYATCRSSVKHVLDTKGWGGLFLGVRASILNVILPFGNWYLLGVPFLVKTRRSLDGMDAVFRAGMGGSLDLIRAILREEGFPGLFAGMRATFWGVMPAFGALCAARLLVHLTLGSSKLHAAQRRRRKQLLRTLLASHTGDADSTDHSSDHRNTNR